MSKQTRPGGAEAHRPDAPRKRGRFVRWIEVILGLVLAPIVVGYELRKITHNDGVARVVDDEVAVIVDYARGEKTRVTMPGYRLYVPWIQEVFRFDKSPNAFVMKGNATGDQNHVPRLLLRAKDGSSFWFEELTLQYALVPEKAELVLEDSGPADEFKQDLLRVHARAILRDEFGRYGAEDVVKPENLQAATRASLARLNAALNPHGIEVLEIGSAKPSFDAVYEEKIARRKVANQDIEKLKADLATLEQQKISGVKAVIHDKELELRKFEVNHARDLALSQKELIRAKAAADLAYDERLRQAHAIQLEKETQAASLTAKYQGFFADTKAHALVLESKGESAVRQALVDKLPGIEFTLVPYSRDPAPQRIEHEQTTASVIGLKD